MNAFSSPLESIPLDYFISDISTIFVSNLWTWLAVFCAGAASLLWRGTKSPATLQLIPDAILTTETEMLEVVAEPEPAGYELQVQDTAYLESIGDIGVTKGKFVAYYYPEESENYESNDEQCDEEHAELVRWFRVEKLERMKEINEMGFYSCQDLTLLSGDIVRLWDGRF